MPSCGLSLLPARLKIALSGIRGAFTHFPHSAFFSFLCSLLQLRLGLLYELQLLKSVIRTGFFLPRHIHHSFQGGFSLVVGQFRDQFTCRALYALLHTLGNRFLDVLPVPLNDINGWTQRLKIYLSFLQRSSPTCRLFYPSSYQVQFFRRHLTHCFA